jgi:hypothetical protein
MASDTKILYCHHMPAFKVHLTVLCPDDVENASRQKDDRLFRGTVGIKFGISNDRKMNRNRR